MNQIHKVSSRLAVSFDGEALVLCEFRPIMPQWPEHGEWCEAARFMTEPEWSAITYVKLVRDEYITDMIMWHWIDAESVNVIDLHT